MNAPTHGIDWLALSPPLVVLAAAASALVADLVPGGRRWSARVAAAGLAIAGVTVGVLALGDDRRTFCVPPSRAPAALGGAFQPSTCSYVVDDGTLLLQGLVVLAGLVVVLMAVPTVRAPGVAVGEAWFLLLVAVAGAVTLAAARDLVTLLLALEVVSVPSFVLVALRRSDPRSGEAALKFFLFSVVTTGFGVFGMSLVYGLTGSVHLDRVSAGFATGLADGRVPEPAAAVALLLVLVAFAFKIAAVPFHFWAPDTYAGAPVPVAAFLSVVSKAAGFTGLLLVLSAGVALADVWAPVLGVLAALTMTVGNLAALRQREATRLLAWSSVAQSGYILAPLAIVAPAAGGAWDGLVPASGTAPAAVTATLTYLAIYAVMNLGAFACVAAVGQARSTVSLDAFRGLGRVEPGLSLALAFFLCCLAGLPPGLVGLVAKLTVVDSLVGGGAVWLAVVVAVNVVIGLAYYLRWAVSMLPERGQSEEQADRTGAVRRVVPLPVVAAVALTAVVSVVVGFWPQLFLAVTSAL